MNATTTRLGRYVGSALMIAIALVFFYGMIWVIWDL